MSGAGKRLEFLLALQEKSGGSISFARWMREALYHPDFGYYTANIRTVGQRGDFSTWATLHDSLGRAIANWLQQNRPRTRPWHVIEVGGGNGALAATVLKHIGWWNRPRYHLVEISPILRQQQQEKLRERPAQWHETLRAALKASDGRALIFSNELADAFPCRIFQNQGGAWRELALRIEAGKVSEVWTESALPDSTVFQETWPDGQRVEVQENYQSWLKEWATAWAGGKMLTIDYGAECPALYHRRPAGTLRSYAHQQRLEGAEVYQGFGRRDITADVNFSDLARWGNKLGFASEGVLSLEKFLEQNNKAPLPAAFRDGAGEAFQVLVQGPLEGQSRFGGT